ncbi:hypothetical protein [Arenibacter algicola]|uniref:hypothetical protein n=1 Tax=Arenibacter algicola TaxID=616991 RepID=UPI0012FD14F3|nr:hypothetical protein [Arenibacter algicola]
MPDWRSFFVVYVPNLYEVHFPYGFLFGSSGSWNFKVLEVVPFGIRLILRDGIEIKHPNRS